MIRTFIMATVASIAVATSASAASPEALQAERARLLAGFLASVGPIAAAPVEQATATTRPAEGTKKAAPAEVRPAVAPAALRLTPASYHRAPSAWLDDYYRLLAR
jgi:hypothetical protein